MDAERAGSCLQLLADVNTVPHPVSLGMVAPREDVSPEDRGEQGSLCLAATRGRCPRGREPNHERCWRGWVGWYPLGLDSFRIRSADEVVLFGCLMAQNELL